MKLDEIETQTALDEALELLESIRKGLEECLDPELSREQVIARLKEVYELLPDEDDDSGDEDEE